MQSFSTQPTCDQRLDVQEYNRSLIKAKMLTHKTVVARMSAETIIVISVCLRAAARQVKSKRTGYRWNASDASLALKFVTNVALATEYD